MVLGALRSYLQLANGLTDVTRQRAVTAARQLLDQGNEAVDQAVAQTIAAGVGRQVQLLAEDLIATSKTNRDLLIGLIRTEVDRTVSRLGLVGGDELAAMANVVGRLQTQFDAARTFGGASASAKPARATTEAPAQKVAVKAPPKAASKAAPKRSASKAAPAKKVAAKTPAKAAPAKKVAARVPAKAASASKTAPVKAGPAKKVAAKKTGRPAS